VHEEVSRIQQLMERDSYVTDPAIATALHLSIALGRPLLIEGHAGVGKTEIARVLTRVLDTELIRLQCYEGLDAAAALYEWNYSKQLLHIRLQEHSTDTPADREAAIFSEPYLLERPLLRAIRHKTKSPVLLLDEIDRSDEEFEAFLLELLDDFQVTIPEIGTIRATHRPHVILTSNRSRELSDALRRRCLYLWIDYPSFDKELRILQAKVPHLNQRLAREIAAFVQSLRRMPLAKTPGVAESLDWARSLVLLHAAQLDESLVRDTLGTFLKDQNDVLAISAELTAGHLPQLISALP
jgi:MoxR-like ATPase